jgi:tape measure domain-containing protein
MADEIVLGVKIKLDGREVDGQVRLLTEDVNRLSQAVRDHGSAAQQSAAQTGQQNDALRDLDRTLRDTASDTDRLSNATQNQANAARQSAEQNNLAATALSAGIKAARAAVASYIAAEGIQLIKTFAEEAGAMRDLREEFAEAEGSALLGARAFQTARELAGASAIDVRTLSRAYMDLQSVGIRPTAAMMETLTNAANKWGDGQAALEDLTERLTKAYVKNKLSGDDLIALNQAGIPIYQLLGDEIGKNAQQLQQMADKGDLTGETIERLIEKMGEFASGGNAEALDTVSGKIDQMRGAWLNFEDALVNGKAAPFFDYMAAKAKSMAGSVIDSVTDVLNVLSRGMSTELDQQIAHRKALLADFETWDPISKFVFKNDGWFDPVAEQKKLGSLMWLKQLEDDATRELQIRKDSAAAIAQTIQWVGDVEEAEAKEAAQRRKEAEKAQQKAANHAASLAKQQAKAEAGRRAEIFQTIQQIQFETSLIGLSDKERQRAVELTQALTKAKGAEVDTIKAALEHKWAELDADQRRNEMWDELVKQANALDKLHDDAAEAKRLARLAQELKLQGLSNEAIKDRIDLEKELASAREANPDLDPKQVEDYVKQRADAEKTLSDIMDAGSKKSADFMETAFKRAAENIQDALANMFESLLNGDATRSFDDFIDNIRRSTTKVFAQEMSTSIQSWLSSAFTSGSNGSGGAAGGFFSGMFDWIKNLWGGSTTPGISSNPAFAGPPTQGAIGNGTGMFSSLFSMGQGGGFSMTSAGGGGWGWGALASLANLIPGAGKVSWKGNQQNKTLQSVIGMENMVTDMVGNFFPLFKLIAPLKNMIMNFGAKLFPDRKPSLMGHMLGQAFGPIGDLLGTFLMGSKIPQPTSWTKGVFSNGKMTLGKSEAFEGGEVQITRDFTRDFGVMLGGVGRLLNQAFGDFRAQFWHQIDKTGGEQVAGGLGDRGGNFWLRQLSTGTLKDLANEAALAVAKRNIANQDDLHYRQAIRDSKGLVGLQNRVNQIDQIGVAIGEYGEALAQLKQINLAFDEMATKAAKYRFAEADIEAARQRAIDALKNDTITAFRQLAGLGPTLAAQLGALNDQMIALEANARSLKIAESELAGLRVKAIAQAREQYLAPLTDATASIADQIASITGVLPTPEATAPLFELLKASTDPTEQRRYIDRIQAALTQRYNAEIAQINKVGQAVNNLKAFVDGLKLSDLSPLDPESRLREAQGQYGTTLLKAQAGDQTALANLANTAQAYLQEAKSFYASSPAYADIFSNVTDTLSGLGETLGGTIDADTAAAEAANTLADSLQSLSDVIQQIIASQGAAFDQQAGGLGTGAQGPAKTFQDLTEDQMAANIAALPANATKAEKAAVKAENKSLQSQINAWLAGGEDELAKTQAYQALTDSIADVQAQLQTVKKTDPQYAPLKAELSGLVAQRKALGKVKFKEQGGWTDGLTIVGENGPELINFARPTQVQSNRQTQSIIAGGNDILIAELQKANAELAALVRLQVKANQELLDRLDKIANASSAMERKTRLNGAA